MSKLAPPPDLSVSQWADANRRLSPESGAEPGRWHTDRAPYQRGIMDAFSEPGVRGVVAMTSAQVGKTEVLNNTAGYFIDLDPAPMLVMQPTLSMAQAWSKDRLATMVRDTPCLSRLIAPPKSRATENTILHKTFPGGNISIVGANSPSDLASRPKRILLADEVDRYPASAGTEGDPFNLARKRLTAFWNAMWGAFSTPTIKGASRIEKLYEQSDQRRYFVPCPLCGHEQTLKWGQLKWESRQPATARYECEACGGAIPHTKKLAMLSRGRWRATAPFNGIAGFHLNELYSVFVTWEDMVGLWYQAQGDSELLKVFVNTSLGETYEEEGQRVDQHSLMARCEAWEGLPAGVRVITAGVDVQDDRLEVEVVGWGRGWESWSLETFVFWGDPGHEPLWRQIDGVLGRTWGGRMIDAMAIDSGGHHTDAVYKFAKDRWARCVYAIKGLAGGWGKPLVGPPTRSNKPKVRLFPVSVDEAKKQLYAWLRLGEPGPGYCHFPAGREEEYFAQLTAETLRQKFVRGFLSFYWEKDRPRNEALDCRVYARAALQVYAPELNEFIDAMEGNIPAAAAPATPAKSGATQPGGEDWLNGGTSGDWGGGSSWLDG